MSSWQHRILREKNLTLAVCFLLLLKGERKKSLTLAAFSFHLVAPGLPACYPLNVPNISNLTGCLVFYLATLTG